MSIRFLIVDDTKFMRKMLTDILKGMDYEVVGEADNGTTAVQMFKQLRPDVTFMDIYMPEVDGIEAMQQIRNIDPKAIVIVCSGTSQQYLISDAMKMGANGYVMKPFKPKQISEVIQKYVLPHLPKPEEKESAASSAKDVPVAERQDAPPEGKAADREKTQEKEAQVKREESREAQPQAKTEAQPATPPEAREAGEEAKPEARQEAGQPAQEEAPQAAGANAQVQPEAEAPAKAEPAAAQANAPAPQGTAAAEEKAAEPAARQDAGPDGQPPEQPAAARKTADPEAPAEAPELETPVDDWPGVVAEEEAVALSDAVEAGKAGEEAEEEITLSVAGEPELEVLAASPEVAAEQDEVSSGGLGFKVLESAEAEADEFLEFSSDVPAWNADEDPDDDHPVLPAAEVIPISELKGGSSKEESGLKEFRSCISCRWKEDVADQEVVYNVTCYEGEPFLRIESSAKGEELLLSFDGLRHLLQWLDKHALQVSGPRKEVARHS